MTTALLIVVACLIIGGIIVAVVRKRRKDQAARAAATAAQTPTDPYAQQAFSGGNPEDIKVGDLIGGLFDEVNGSALRTVRGSVVLRDGNYRWTEHFLQSDNDIRQYLSVERETNAVVTVLWTAIPTVPTVTPGESLSFVSAGVGYERDEKGTATYTTLGTTDDLLTNGTVRYCDYKGDDGSRISFEQFDGGTWECSRGEVVTNLIIYPKP